MTRVGYKQTELGEIPLEWEVKKLEEVIEKIVGGGTPSRIVEKYYVGSIPWATVKDMKYHYLDKTQEYISEEAVKSSTSNLIPENKIIISTRMAVGRAFINLVPMAINQDLKALFPREGVNSDFILFWFLNNADKFISLSVGSTVKGIRLEALTRQKISLPPLLEQQKIAHILESVDRTLEATRDVIGALEGVRRGLMQQLFSRGIPGRHTRFKPSEVGEIPLEWEVKLLGELSKRITDGTHQAVKTNKIDEIPFLYISCIEEGKIKWLEALKISKEVYDVISRGREPCKGMILYTAVGSYGNAVIVEDNKPFAFQRHIACILPKTQKLNPKFLELWLNSPKARQQGDWAAVGNAQKTVTLGGLSKFSMPVPTLEEQTEIVETLTRFDLSLEWEKFKLEALEDVKKALMQALLSGRVRVPLAVGAAP